MSKSLGNFTFNQRSDWLIFQGTFISSLSISKLKIIENGLMGIKNGIIKFIYDNIADVPNNIYNDIQKYNIPIKVLKRGEFLIPGFIDTHTHAAQYSFSGGGRIPLLQWLNKYTFPTECRFKDDKFATDIYTKAVKRHLMNGTTTCCYYGTIHLSSSKILTNIIHKIGQRAYIGKVCMDRNAPDYYIETTENSINDTKLIIEYINSLNTTLIKPIITPRFVPTCTSTLMNNLSNLANEYELPIQSHISENKEEIAWVKELHPDCNHYTDVYYKHGLLNHRTIMAHGIYLSQDELDLFKQQNAGISHCPNSNYSLNSGIADIKSLIQQDIKIGLGTDVAGGYHTSILNSIRQAIIASKSKCFEHDNNQINHQQTNDNQIKPLNYIEAFYLATIGGAKLCNIQDMVGSFEVNKEFDALVINLNVKNTPVDIFDMDTIENLFQKFIFLADDRNIIQIYVAGKKCVDKDNEENVFCCL